MCLREGVHHHYGMLQTASKHEAISGKDDGAMQALQTSARPWCWPHLCTCKVKSCMQQQRAPWNKSSVLCMSQHVASSSCYNPFTARGRHICPVVTSVAVLREHPLLHCIEFVPTYFENLFVLCSENYHVFLAQAEEAGQGLSRSRWRCGL